MSAQDVAYPRDRGQVRMMRQAGMSIRDCAEWFGVTEVAVERTLEELRAERGPEYFRELMPRLAPGPERRPPCTASRRDGAADMRVTAVCINHRRNDAGQHEVSICYYDWEEELIALGVATSEMLGRKVKGRKRVDADGDRFNVSWYSRLDDSGQPQQFYKLVRIKPVEAIDHLPLAREAIAEYLGLLEAERSRARR
jgi:hypothetical protein